MLRDEVRDVLPEQWTESDERFMRLALHLADKAQRAGDVPVGAVLVSAEGKVGEGWNQSVALCDPTAHAELQAVRAAASTIANYRLGSTTLYVTLEPCVMCAGALVLARIDRLVFATRDLRFGGVRSKFALADSDLLNHRLLVQEGLLAAEAAALLVEFFRQRRPGARI
jgi:tRNA(adenine34) deaminase